MVGGVRRHREAPWQRAGRNFGVLFRRSAGKVTSGSRPRVAVVVAGDLGRSPRMQNQALALAEELAEVDLVGEGTSPLRVEVERHPHIHCHFFRSRGLAGRHRWPRPLFVLYAALRALKQAAQLSGLLLFSIARPDAIVVQNPPAIPTLLLCLAVARWRSAILVVDWHNFGYTLLAQTLGARHPAVRLASWWEQFFGRRADLHFCVSQAMRERLARSWGIDATVLYDRPTQFFRPTPLAARADLFRRLRNDLSWPDPYDPAGESRPAVILSSSSWTVDEDFQLLLDAVSRGEQITRAHDADTSRPPFSHLLVVLTGQGVLRRRVEEEMARLCLRKIHLRTVWLTPEDYSLLLGSADLGLCLHRSSSGVDLPMKVVDMLGSGLPVCALDYGPCLSEQLRHGECGLLFSSAGELADHLYQLFRDLPRSTPLLDTLRHHVSLAAGRRWQEEWKLAAEPLLRSLLGEPVRRGDGGS